MIIYTHTDLNTLLKRMKLRESSNDRSLRYVSKNEIIRYQNEVELPNEEYLSIDSSYTINESLYKVKKYIKEKNG